MLEETIKAHVEMANEFKRVFTQYLYKKAPEFGAFLYRSKNGKKIKQKKLDLQRRVFFT